MQVNVTLGLEIKTNNGTIEDEAQKDWASGQNVAEAEQNRLHPLWRPLKHAAANNSNGSC